MNAFLSWLARRTGEAFTVVDRPNPPDAIVQSAKRTTWIEVTDAFYSNTWAQDLFSSATPDEEHKPMPPGIYKNMDARFAANFTALLKRKLSKKSYCEVCQKYGPGILLVGIESPWFGADTCEQMREECQKTDWSTDRGNFGRVIISFPSFMDQSFEEWDWDARHAPARLAT